jgi:hypothetical protein
VYLGALAFSVFLGWLSDHPLRDWQPLVPRTGMSDGSYDLILSTVAGSLIVTITICFAAAVSIAVAAASDPRIRPVARLTHLERQGWMFFPFTMLALTFYLLAKRALGDPPTAAGLVCVMIVGLLSLLSFIWLALLVYRSLDKPRSHGQQ